VSKSTSNTGKPWTAAERAQLARLARGNTPTGIIGLKLKRTASAVENQAHRQKVSLKPTNRSPYNRRSK